MDLVPQLRAFEGPADGARISVWDSQRLSNLAVRDPQQCSALERVVRTAIAPPHTHPHTHTTTTRASARAQQTHARTRAPPIVAPHTRVCSRTELSLALAAVKKGPYRVGYIVRGGSRWAIGRGVAQHVYDAQLQPRGRRPAPCAALCTRTDLTPAVLAQVGAMGEGSAKAQALAYPITTLRRLSTEPSHRLYVLLDWTARRALGILK